MFSAPRVILPLRILLVLAALYTLMLMVLSIPGSFIDDLGRFPGGAHLLWPVFLAVEAGGLAFLVIIVCTWQLLTLVKHERIFSEGAMLWVNLIVRIFVAGWLVFCVLAAYLTLSIYFSDDRDPGVPVVLFGGVLLGAVVVMIVAVLRSLLTRAAVLQSDLDEVI